MATLYSKLTWDDSPSGGSPITSFRALVFEGDTLVTTTSLPAEDDPALLIPHSATVERTVLVQAKNAFGWSAPVSVTAPMGTAPDPQPVAPTLVAAPGNNQATLSVTGGTYDHIEITRDGQPYDSAPVFPLIDRSVGNGVAYSYQASVTLGGIGPVLSNVASVTPAAAGAPTPVTITAARRSADQTKVDVAITNQGTGTWLQHAVFVGSTAYWNPATLPGAIEQVPATPFTVKVRSTYRVSGVNYTVDSNVVNIPAAATGGTLPAGVTAPTIELVSVGERQALIRFLTPGTGYAAIQMEARRNGALESFSTVQAPITANQETTMYSLTPGVEYSLVAVTVYQDASGYHQVDGANVKATALGFLGVVPTLAIDPSPTKLTVRLASAGSGWVRADLYVIDSNGVEDMRVFKSVTFPYEVSGLTDGNIYNVAVVVEDTSGYQDQTLFFDGTPGEPPAYTTAQGGTFQAGRIQDAPMFTADGVATWSTTGKTNSSGEDAVTTAANGRIRIPAWFKFYLGVAATVRISGLPGYLGYDPAQNGAGSDTYMTVFRADNGNVTDAQLPSALTSVIAADDEAGSGQPAISFSFTPGWYYVAMAAYSAGSVTANERIAFKDLPVGQTTPPTGPTPVDDGGLS